jgi:hypothetical protein
MHAFSKGNTTLRRNFRTLSLVPSLEWGIIMMLEIAHAPLLLVI